MHTILKAGGSYVMALGGENLPDPGVQERQGAVMAKAVEMGLVAAGDGGRIRVYDANLIARWATLYPALAVHPILQGRQLGVIDIDRWKESFVHRYLYSPDETRQGQIDALRASMLGHGPIDVRLQGESGIGKTRLALEALDDSRLRHLVAYIDDDSRTGGGLIESLIDQGRHAIVVVDECPAERHIKLAAKLTSNPGVRLVTIGDVGSSRSSGPILGLEALGADAMEGLIESSFPGMNDVARRFVVDHSNGAPGFAIWLAGAVERTPDAQAADMIGRDDIEQFITKYLPDGKDFSPRRSWHSLSASAGIANFGARWNCGRTLPEYPPPTLTQHLMSWNGTGWCVRRAATEAWTLCQSQSSWLRRPGATTARGSSMTFSRFSTTAWHSLSSGG